MRKRVSTMSMLKARIETLLDKSITLYFGALVFSGVLKKDTKGYLLVDHEYRLSGKKGCKVFYFELDKVIAISELVKKGA